jgi:hypothetical protein
MDQLGTAAILYPHGGDVAHAFHKSLHDLGVYDREKELNLLRHELSMRSGANICRARNMLVQTFLTTDCEWAWWCDTDMVFAPEALARLLVAAKTADTKIIGGLCVLVGDDGLIPTLFVDDPDTVTKVSHNYPDDAVVEVAATGTGCLLVHRDVFLDIQTAAGGSEWCWFTEGERIGGDGIGRWIGEDVNFCLQARALGHQVYVDCTTHIGHVKGPRTWWPEDLRRGHGLEGADRPAVLDADIERIPIEFAVEEPLETAAR